MQSYEQNKRLLRPHLPPRIAFQGERGANSHIACEHAFPDYEPVPCETFEEALAAVSEESVALGMIPIENSVAGRVADIHTLLPHSGLTIIGELFLPINHQLMALPGVTLSELKEVQSHIQALGQCRRTLLSLGLKSIAAADTAGSARQVAELGSKKRAAIASTLAAEVYGLTILKKDIEDEAHNTTRFLFLTKEGAWYPADGEGTIVTTFVFEVRNIPAALYKCLGGFATNSINITKLESYQIGGTFQASQFYADVEGHPESPALKRAFDELSYFSQRLDILGVYPGGAVR